MPFRSRSFAKDSSYPASDPARPLFRPATAHSETHISPFRETKSSNLIRGYLRGSSLLLGGRVLAVFVNFAIQVLTVRYFAKEDYGAFAFALSVVSFATNTILLGLGKSVPRLVAVYQEQRDYPRVFGSIALAVSAVWALGLTLVLTLHAFKVAIGQSIVTDPDSLALLLLMVALAPIDAFDNLLQQLAAIFAGPRAIFLRRQLVGPLFKLATVLAVTYAVGDVYMLAYGYLIGSLIGVAMYMFSVADGLKRHGMWLGFSWKTLVFPVRDVAHFSLPLLASDISIILRGFVAVMVLQYFGTTSDVAEYRAVFPVAGLNMLAFDALGFLFVPLASRMFARDDNAGINELYWQTSLWIAVLTFPVFAVTFALARPLTVWLFGVDYAAAASVLSILAVGYYVNAAVGFNGASLRVHGNVKTIAVVNLITASACVVLAFVLVRRFGVIGAALSTTATLILQNVLNHLGLWMNQTAVQLFDWRFLKSYVLIIIAAGLLIVVDRVIGAPVLVTLAAIVVTSLLLVRFSRRTLDVGGRFPELMKLPLAARLLA